MAGTQREAGRGQNREVSQHQVETWPWFGRHMGEAIGSHGEFSSWRVAWDVNDGAHVSCSSSDGLLCEDTTERAFRGPPQEASGLMTPC